MGSIFLMGAGAALTFTPMGGKSPGIFRRILGVSIFLFAFVIYVLGVYVRGVSSGAF